MLNIKFFYSLYISKYGFEKEVQNGRHPAVELYKNGSPNSHGLFVSLTPLVLLRTTIAALHPLNLTAGCTETSFLHSRSQIKRGFSDLLESEEI